jgi:hypothetical protein
MAFNAINHLAEVVTHVSQGFSTHDHNCGAFGSEVKPASVIIAADIAPLPGVLAISAITLAELHSYGRLAAAVVDAGRQPRRRVMDLLIAATAHVHGARLYTRNVDDFAGLEDLVEITGI